MRRSRRLRVEPAERVELPIGPNDMGAAAIDAIFRERIDELPEPLALLPGRWETNPFDGKPIFQPPRYPR